MRWEEFLIVWTALRMQQMVDERLDEAVAWFVDRVADAIVARG